jgi:hypothetical protein
MQVDSSQLSVVSKSKKKIANYAEFAVVVDDIFCADFANLMVIRHKSLGSAV